GTKMTTTPKTAAAIGLAFVLVLASCGSDDATESTPATTAPPANTETANTETANTEAGPESTTAAAPADGVPSGATVVSIEADLSSLDGISVGIANLAPVPGAERWSRPLEQCLVD